MEAGGDEGKEAVEEGACDPGLLQGPCDSRDWKAFLEQTCHYCRKSCLRRYSLLDWAWQSWESAAYLHSQNPRGMRSACLQGHLAAALVLVQLLGRDFLDLPDTQSTLQGLADPFRRRRLPNGTAFGGLSLTPFPLDFRLWPVLRRLSPALGATSCWGEGGAAEASGLSSPSSSIQEWALPAVLLPRLRVPQPLLLPLDPEADPAPWCPVHMTQKHLSRKCQQRMRSRFLAQTGNTAVGSDARLLLGSALAGLRQVQPPLPEWRCPPNGTSFSSKYTMAGRGCADGYGMWGKPLEEHLRCIITVVGEALQVKPGNTVLDWGSGCGWMLSWLHLLYGAIGYGIDGTANAHAFSLRHSAGRFCLWSDPNLDWVPDAAFDHVIAYWALYHVRPASRLCGMAAQLVSKLRPGGRAWFGGNDPSLAANIGFQAFSQKDWTRCLGSLARRKGLALEVEFAMDGDLFRSSLYTEEVPGDYLYLKPTYSVFVTRLPGTTSPSIDAFA
mmetsp:Transcript_121771/g.315965  ORF Transcript_121771/g.315965 Transcript_121771/m.315965 type:complete len:499 (-) Transcript_121771:33-1529(-)